MLRKVLTRLLVAAALLAFFAPFWIKAWRESLWKDNYTQCLSAAKTGEYEFAEARCKAALAEAERIWWDADDRRGRSMAAFAELYRRQGRYALAEPLYFEALKIFTDLEDDSQNVLAVLHSLGGFYLVQKRYDEAAPILQRSLGLLKKLHSSDARVIVEASRELAAAREGQGKRAEAVALLAEALSPAENRFGPKSKVAVETREALSKLTATEGEGRKARKSSP